MTQNKEALDRIIQYARCGLAANCEMESKAQILDRQIDEDTETIRTALNNTESREKVAQFMLGNSIATGHGDTLDDLLTELQGWIDDRRGLIRGCEWREIKEGNLPELKDDSVLVHFENGSIETVHIEDYFKDITAGLDSQGDQLYTKSCFSHDPKMTHWRYLPAPPKGQKQ